MRPRSLMLIAGEPSGDALGAELVAALRAEHARTPSLPDRAPYTGPARDRFAPTFFGAGGSRMAAAGVDLAFDLTRHSVIGLWEVIRQYRRFHQRFQQLLRLALDRQPEVIVGIDFSGFNRRFAAAVRRAAQSHSGPFHNWSPKLVQFVSPQVWASRPGRARQMSHCLDLILSIIPFEPDWYARHAPNLPVVYVGHPLLDRHAHHPPRDPATSLAENSPPHLVLLPGSRDAELNRHVPVMLDALRLIRRAHPDLRATLVLPDPVLARTAGRLAGWTGDGSPPDVLPGDVTLSVEQLAETLSTADLAMASTGTVTMECAYFGVPTVAIYKTSWSTYQIGRRIIRVPHLAMPNLIAGRALFPEFIQHEASPDRIAHEILTLLDQPDRVREIREGLRRVLEALGPPGAIRRAASAILKLLEN